jgi:hypothetical protein
MLFSKSGVSKIDFFLGFLSLRIPHGADVNRVQKAKYSNRK